MQTSRKRPKVHVRKGDMVQIITGKDKGKSAKILKVFGTESRVIVEGLNMMIRHVRPNPQAGITGGRVEQERSMHHSNVMLVCPKCGKRTRHRVSRASEKERRRVCLLCNSEF